MISFQYSFFDSTPLLRTNLGGANSVVRGLCEDPADSVDTTFVNDLHNFLFASRGKLVFPLFQYKVKEK